MRPPVFLTFLLLIGSLSIARSQYPDWFLYPDKYPSTVAGFSYFGTPAVTDAERMACVYREVIVDGVLELFVDRQRDQFLRNSDYYYYFSPDSLDRMRGTLQPLDRFSTNVLMNDDIVLFALDTLTSVAGMFRRSLDSLETPGWLDRSFWRENSFYYGVGTYTFRGNENAAWKTAEERAIYMILTSLAAEFHALKSSQTGEAVRESLERIQFVKLKYLVRNIQPVARWLDRANDVCMVLIKIPQNKIVSPYLRQTLPSTDGNGNDEN